MTYRNVRITIDGEGREAFVRSPYEAKDVIRDMPYRKWNPGTKTWVIPAEDVEMLKMKLEDEGFTVLVIDERTRQNATSEPPPTTPPTDDPQGAYVKMLQEVQSLKAQLQATTTRNQDLVARNRAKDAEILNLRTQLRVDQFNQRFGGSGMFGRRGGGSNWASDMFSAMSPELAAKAYKKLSTALHPDLGGDVELMKLINVAYENSKR